MDKSKTFYKILDEICQEKNIKQTMLSFDWIRELKKEEKVHHVIRYQFDLNSANAYQIAKDKYATYVILKENNVPVIRHEMIFNPVTRKNYFEENYEKKIQQILNDYDKVVIKANDSSQGKEVYCSSNIVDAKKIIQKHFQLGKDSMSICPYVEIDYEYRVIVLDEDVLYVYKKKKPYVIGNGNDTLRQLIQNKYGESCDITVNEELDMKQVPEFGREICISWKHNLSNGAEAVIISKEDEYLPQIKEIAILAAKAIGIRFASIDIALTSTKDLTIVEVNGSVCMNKFAEMIPNGYEIAKEIYTKAIDKVFENDNRE